jgi:hypothetical protein
VAGDWIMMRVDLEEDPRVVWVAAQLKCNACHVTGALHKLWSLADQFTTDGILRLYTPQIIDTKVGLPGFTELLSRDEVQWVKIGPDFLQVIDFETFNGLSAKTRAQTYKRVQKHRQKRNGEPLQKRYHTTQEKNKEQSTARAPRATAANGNGDGGNHRDEPSGGEQAVVTDADRTAAREAMDRWSRRRRADRPIEDFNNESRLLNQMLDALAQDTIVHGGETIRRHKLVPLVVESLAADDKVRFPEIRYAIKCVKNRLDEWAREGVPGNGRARDQPAGGQQDDAEIERLAEETARRIHGANWNGAK